MPEKRTITRQAASRRSNAITKRQRTVHVHDAAECVTYDALVDDAYPLERIEEHLLRLLAFESTVGIGEVLSLALRSVGCSVTFSVTGVGATTDEIVTEVEAIESRCLEAPAGFPSLYDMQRADYVKRVRSLFASVAEKLGDVSDADIVLVLAKYTAVLTTARLQSLRLAGTVLCGCFVEPFSSHAAASTALRRALNERSADVSAPIRRIAVTDLSTVGEVDSVVRALNDPVGSVRVAAVRSLASYSGDLEMSEAAWQRVFQLARQDVDLGVRRVSLKFLAAKGLTQETSLLDMLVDADVQSRNYAAVFIVGHIALTSNTAWSLLLSLSRATSKVLESVNGDRAASALVFALERQKQKFKVSWIGELGALLTKDWLKEARSSLLASQTKKEYRALAAELDDTTMQRQLLGLYAKLAGAAGSGSSLILLETLPRIITKVRYDDDLLAIAVSVASHLSSDKLLERPDSEDQMQHLFKQILELLHERSESSIARAASMAFAALPNTHRQLLLKDAYHDLRLKLATCLGPRGIVAPESLPHLHHVILQLLVLARFVDISDLAKLPIWPRLISGDDEVRQLVRALGMKGTAELAEQCIEKLMLVASGPAVDEILQIFVSAKMRGVNLGPLPFDINDRPPTTDTIWTAAVAANII